MKGWGGEQDAGGRAGRVGDEGQEARQAQADEKPEAAEAEEAAGNVGRCGPGARATAEATTPTRAAALRHAVQRPAPRLVNPELGLDNLVARAGHNAGYEIDLTLLDAPDHRLIRSGVLLAHRVLDGRGEWYLGAPDWVPLLPKELIEPMSQADLPEEMADLIRPFRRRAPLSPVAALRCERREFALRARQGPPLALLRDDKVTVRRGGLTTARYREVMLTPVGAGLQPQQREWLDTCLIGAGATVLTRFPPLVRRLGAPATGPTDFPEPTPLDAGASFASFVSTLIALRLRQLLTGDLRLRGGDPSAALELTRTAALLRGELDGLGGVLDSSWTDDLIDELDWLAAVPVTVGESPDELTAQCRAGCGVSGTSACSTGSSSRPAGSGWATSPPSRPAPSWAGSPPTSSRRSPGPVPGWRSTAPPGPGIAPVTSSSGWPSSTR